MEQISAQMGGVSQVWIQAILVFFFSFFFLLPSHTVFIWLLWKGFLQLCSDSSHHWGTDSQIYWRGEKEKVLPGNYLQTGRDLAESTSLRTTSINRTQSDPDLAFKISLRSDHWWSKYRQVLWFAPKCAYFKSTKQMIHLSSMAERRQKTWKKPWTNGQFQVPKKKYVQVKTYSNPSRGWVKF